MVLFDVAVRTLGLCVGAGEALHSYERRSWETPSEMLLIGEKLHPGILVMQNSFAEREVRDCRYAFDELIAWPFPVPCQPLLVSLVSLWVTTPEHLRLFPSTRALPTVFGEINELWLCAIPQNLAMGLSVSALLLLLLLLLDGFLLGCISSLKALASFFCGAGLFLCCWGPQDLLLDRVQACSLQLRYYSHIVFLHFDPRLGNPLPVRGWVLGKEGLNPNQHQLAPD